MNTTSMHVRFLFMQYKLRTVKICNLTQIDYYSLAFSKHSQSLQLMLINLYMYFSWGCVYYIQHSFHMILLTCSICTYHDHFVFHVTCKCWERNINSFRSWQCRKLPVAYTGTSYFFYCIINFSNVIILQQN